MKKFHATDMTDEQWELIQTLLPPDKKTGRPRTTDLRAIM
jgi:putative transposase